PIPPFQPDAERLPDDHAIACAAAGLPDAVAVAGFTESRRETTGYEQERGCGCSGTQELIDLDCRSQHSGAAFVVSDTDQADLRLDSGSRYGKQRGVHRTARQEYETAFRNTDHTDRLAIRVEET